MSSPLNLPKLLIRLKYLMDTCLLQRVGGVKEKLWQRVKKEIVHRREVGFAVRKKIIHRRVR
ncbi:MAG: hypothetical protein HY913_19460 [Desulfomonile tiedjei]|nr:hypothetical protein [Desulfomonile tiedjei]